MKFKVIEIGTYVASKVIEAVDEATARDLYIDNPCESDDYNYSTDQFKVEEVKDDEETDDLSQPLLPQPD